MSPEAIATTFPAMGGTIELQLVGGSAGDANRLKALFADHERTMSRFLPESELCALNRAVSANSIGLLTSWTSRSMTS